MIKLQYQNIYNHQDHTSNTPFSIGINKILKADTTIQTALKFRKLIKQLDEHLALIRPIVANLFQTYGQEIEGGRRSIREESTKDYADRMFELMSTEVEIDFEPIDLESPEYKNVVINSGDLLALESILIFEEVKEIKKPKKK